MSPTQLNDIKCKIVAELLHCDNENTLKEVFMLICTGNGTD